MGVERMDAEGDAVPQPPTCITIPVRARVGFAVASAQGNGSLGGGNPFSGSLGNRAQVACGGTGGGTATHPLNSLCGHSGGGTGGGGGAYVSVKASASVGAFPKSGGASASGVAGGSVSGRSTHSNDLGPTATTVAATAATTTTAAVAGSLGGGALAKPRRKRNLIYSNAVEGGLAPSQYSSFSTTANLTHPRTTIYQ